MSTREMPLPLRYRREIAEALAAYCENEGRALPWRENKTPYRVWISEIMLQQTRAEVVKRYYEPFLAAFPSPTALANADGDRVRKAWEGLGYYRRIALAQKAATIVRDEYGGTRPADYYALRRLPGFGDYTASAVAAFAFGLRAAAVDGNLLRVLARLFAYEGNVLETKHAAALRALAVAMLPDPMPQSDAALAEGDALYLADGGTSAVWNQAMMELGAQICIPNGTPHCARCPLSPYCTACAEGRAEALPLRVSRTKRRTEEKTVLRIVIDGLYLIRRRSESGLLAGLFEFPTLDGAKSAEEVCEHLRRLGLAVKEITPLSNAKHIFTHVTWQMHGYHIEAAPPSVFPSDMIVASETELSSVYPIPGAYRAYRP